MIGLQWRPGKQPRKAIVPVVILAGTATPPTERAQEPERRKRGRPPKAK